MIIDLRQPAAVIEDDSEEMDGSRRARRRRRRKRAASFLVPGVGIGRAVKKRRQRRRARRATANTSNITARQLLLREDSTEEMSGLGGYEKASLALSAVGIAVAAYGTFYMTRNQKKNA